MPHVAYSDPETGAPRRVELKPGPNRLGRGRENEIMVPSGRLSRGHARLDLVDGLVTLRDLGSSNGTELRGERITFAPLRAGDVFRCGGIDFQLVPDGDESTPTVTRVSVEEDRVRRLEDLLGDASDSSAIRVQPGGNRDSIKLKVLLEVSRVLSSPGAPDELLRRVLDLLFRVFDIDRAALVPIDQGTGELGEAISAARFGPAGPDPIFSRQIVDAARREPEGIVVPDAIEDPRFAQAVSVRQVAIRSVMCAPMVARGAALGVLYVDHLRMPLRYGKEDLDFLSSFAAQAATALENARLFAHLETQAVQRGRLLRFFPPALLSGFLDAPDFGTPRDHEVTVLFSDISGFTSMSSSMKSRDVVALLNGYFPPMAEIVFRLEGTLEKYIGDALMAIWGAPVTHEDDADRAVRAAMEMTDRLREMNAERAAAGLSPLSVHIGLNSGPVTFGNIGSAEYVQFAAIGDTTNVASRVCSVAQAGEVVISRATKDRLLRPEEWAYEALPPARVKGKDVELELYRVRRA